MASTKNLKHRLPVISELPHITVDATTLKVLQDLVVVENAKFQSVADVNKELCGNHHVLATSVYDAFHQIGLTTSLFSTDTFDLSACGTDQGGTEVTARQKRKLVTSDNSPLNELTNTVRTPFYTQHSAVFDKLLCQFKGEPTRLRLVRLDGKSIVDPHIDYDPSYATRVIIPIDATDECVNLFWVKGCVEAHTLKPGKAYFLNTGFKHAVVNMAKMPRYTFMVTLKGTEDIDHLLGPTP